MLHMQEVNNRSQKQKERWVKYREVTPYKLGDGTILDVSKKFIQDYRSKILVCEICGNAEKISTQNKNRYGKRTDFTPNKLCVDHDHQTGKFRGLLCVKCNQTLGWIEANMTSYQQYLNKKFED